MRSPSRACRPARSASSCRRTAAKCIAGKPNRRTSRETAKEYSHGASRGTTIENNPAPQERKKPERDPQESELKRVQAAIAGDERGNWRDLRTVFEFAGISAQNKEAPS